MARKKEFWLTRDKRRTAGEEAASYELWTEEPSRNERDGADGDVVFDVHRQGPATEFCPFLFEKATGIILKPGEGFKILLAIKVLRSKRIRIKPGSIRRKFSEVR